LIPRMKDFDERHPEVRVNMGVHTDLFTFDETHFEAAIHFGQPTWPGTSSDYLFGEEVVPVCRPSLLKGSVRTAADLLEYPLLHSTTRPSAWTQWFAEQRIEDHRALQGVRYELHTMLIAGAAAGLGVALVPKFFVEGQLATFGLTIPVDVKSVAESAYYLVYPTELTHGQPLSVFREWLLTQASAYRPDALV